MCAVMFNGGGLNPRKMKKMMEQMGIELEELEVDNIIMNLSSGEKLVFRDAEVTMMEARGQKTYQVIGEPEIESSIENTSSENEFDEKDIEMIMEKAGVDRETAHRTIESTEGDLAAAIYRLK